MLKIKYKCNMKGFSFTELMIAMVLSTLLLAAGISIFSANIKYYRASINIDRLNRQLQMAVDLMETEIRRAGYWANARSDVAGNSNNNPFVANATDLAINAGGDCILFTYDRDNDGSLPAINSAIDDERYGFRLSNQALQTRPPGAAFDCTAATSAWENITDPGFMQITALSFTLTTKTVTTGPGTKAISMRSVDISITGRLTSDTTVTKTLTQHVRLRNDKYIP